MPRISETARRQWLGRLFYTARIAAIAGTTLSLSDLFDALMDAGLHPAGMEWVETAPPADG